MSQEADDREKLKEGMHRPVRTPPDLCFEQAVKLTLLGLLAYWSFVLIRPFLTIALWTLILTVTLYPVYNLVSRLFRGRRKVAAATVTLFSLIVFTGPVIWLGISMAEGLISLSERINSGAITVPPPPDAVRRRQSADHRGPSPAEHQTLGCPPKGDGRRCSPGRPSEPR